MGGFARGDGQLPDKALLLSLPPFMKSLRELYKIGNGPSSSHTMGPQRAARAFAADSPGAHAFRVTLYGSLAATGRGHLTDQAILQVLQPLAPTEIVWRPDVVLPFHPNGMCFEALEADGQTVALSRTVYSIGGGALSDGHSRAETTPDIYPLTTIADILARCEREGSTYWEYVEECEGTGIWDYLREVWQVMCAGIERGLNNEGVLPGGIGVRRKAATYYVKAKGYIGSLNSRGHIYAYALATSEENASGGRIVTAPTCGSSGVLPAVLYHVAKAHEFREVRILRALATAGLFGNIAKENASISGAEVGCQGEVGSASSMAAAGLAEALGGTPAQVENAAEIAMEHNLGLTCDPVGGLVQIPCIERNAVAAVKAINAARMALWGEGRHAVSLDTVIETMRQTGEDMLAKYKETSRGGLAVNVVEC